MNKASFLQDFFKDKRVFITGHTGFMGSWLTHLLLRCGAKVSGYALEPSTNPNLFNILKTKNKINNHFGDIRDLRMFSSILKKEKPELLFHLAAQPLVRESYDNPIYTYETNAIGTANVLEAVKETQTVKSAVIITTDKVYENKEWDRAYTETDQLGGFDPYSASKACAELIVKSYIKSFFNPEACSKTHNTLIASARAGNAFGGGDWSKDRLVPDIIRAIFEKDTEIVLRYPDAIRPWQHTLDPLLGYMQLSMQLYQGEKSFVGAWNFGPDSGSIISVEALVKKSLSLLNKGRYIVKKDTKKHEAKILKLDAAKAKEHLHWRSLLPVDEAIRWTFDWYAKYYNKEDMEAYTNQQIDEYLKKTGQTT